MTLRHNFIVYLQVDWFILIKIGGEKMLTQLNGDFLSHKSVDDEFIEVRFDE